MDTNPPKSHTILPLMTTAMARVIIESHKDCRSTHCPVKLQAKTRLVHAGLQKLQPRPGV